MSSELETKSATIEELQARLGRQALDGRVRVGVAGQALDEEGVAILAQAVADREEQIEKLQQKLALATRSV